MNLLSNLPEELTIVLQEGNGVRIERIVSTGHRSPEGFWCDPPENELVLVLQGAARLQFKDWVVELSRGDWINIPAHQKQRVEWTSPHHQKPVFAPRYRTGLPSTTFNKRWPGVKGSPPPASNCCSMM